MNETNKTYIPTGEASRLLRMAPNTARAKARSGELDYIIVDDQLKISVASIEDYLEQKRIEYQSNDQQLSLSLHEIAQRYRTP